MSCSHFPGGIPVRAAGLTVFDVNSFDDIKDHTEGNLVCSVGSAVGGPCTLRAALQEADDQVRTSDVLINLPPGVYTLSIPNSVTPPDHHMGDLDIVGLDADYGNEITIRGTGQQPSVINANAIDRVLEIGQFQKVTLQNLVITGGRLEASGENTMGGGIMTRAVAEVNLFRVIIENNQIVCPAETPFCSAGGGIGVENSHLFLSHSQVSHNSAYVGAAIYIWDGNMVPIWTTTILNSTISGHTIAIEISCRVGH